MPLASTPDLQLHHDVLCQQRRKAGCDDPDYRVQHAHARHLDPVGVVRTVSHGTRRRSRRQCISSDSPRVRSNDDRCAGGLYSSFHRNRAGRPGVAGGPASTRIRNVPELAVRKSRHICFLFLNFSSNFSRSREAALSAYRGFRRGPTVRSHLVVAHADRMSVIVVNSSVFIVVIVIALPLVHVLRLHPVSVGFGVDRLRELVRPAQRREMRLRLQHAARVAELHRRFRSQTAPSISPCRVFISAS